jgi:hypothetical protein
VLTPFTSNDEVRSCLGVTADELSDETLDLPIHEKNLRFEFDEISDGLAAGFKVVDAIAEAQRTDVQRRFYDAVVLFAPQAVAVALGQSLPLFAPKAITDGKAGVTRVADPQFEKLLDRCKQNYERFKQNLAKRYASYANAVAPIVVTSTVLVVVSPSTDPVTG